MSNIIELKGDLLDAFVAGEVDSIVHGANCWCQFGAGIALQIKQQFPDAYKEDQFTISGDKRKMGMFTFSQNSYGIIFNAYTQYDYGTSKKQFDEDAFRKSLEKIKYFIIDKEMDTCSTFKGSLKDVKVEHNIKSLGMARRIGAGFAGGNMEVNLQIIKDVFEGSNIIIKLYEL